jgi:hypothetical protein
MPWAGAGPCTRVETSAAATAMTIVAPWMPAPLMGELWLEPTMPFSDPGHHPLACSDGRVGPYRFARKRGIVQAP